MYRVKYQVPSGAEPLNATIIHNNKKCDTANTTVCLQSRVKRTRVFPQSRPGSTKSRPGTGNGNRHHMVSWNEWITSPPSYHITTAFIFLTVSTGVRAGVRGLRSTRPILSSTPPLSTLDPHTTTPDSIIRSPNL